MPRADHDRRPDVLQVAAERGWSHEVDTTSHGAITDQFAKDRTTLTCFWAQTPWSDARWLTGTLARPDGPRLVWRVEGVGGVLAVLRS